MRMTPASAPPQTPVLVDREPGEPAVLGLLVDGPNGNRRH
jgi:hypothetical protein